MRSPAGLQRQRRDWEELAGFNPEWAVLSDPETRFGRWDMDEFFATGEARVGAAMRVGAELDRPRRAGSVLDFGCGVGRLSRALSARFERYVGADISAGMIERARQLGGDDPGRTFVLNDAPDLARFEDREFDAVFSFLVLQHVPDRAQIGRYLSEFARVLAPGGLIAIQVPSRLPLVYRVGWRRHAYRVVRRLGITVERAHRLGLHNVALQALPEPDARAALERGGAEVLRAVSERGRHGDVPLHGSVSTVYYATRR